MTDVPHDAGPEGSAPRRAWAAARRQLRVFRESPATVGFLAVVWTLAAVSGSLPSGPSRAVRQQVAVSVHALSAGRVHTLLTAVLWERNLFGYLIMAVIVLLVLGRIERDWGSLRLIVVAVLTQAVGVGLGLLAVSALPRVAGSWSARLAATSTVGAGPMVVGVLMAYTASIGVLWRRRMRLGVLVVLTTLVLYGGRLRDVLLLATALVGLAVGAVLTRRPPGREVKRPGPQERRTLVAVLLAATAVGPVLAALSPAAVGPLSVLRYLFTSPDVEPSSVATICADPANTEPCADLLRQLRYDGIGPAVLSVLPSVLVLVVAAGLRRGRRFAYRAAVAIHVLLTGFGLIVAVALLRPSGQDVTALAIRTSHGVVGAVVALVQPALVLLVLLATRRSFDIAAPPGTYARAAKVAVAAIVGAFGLYVAVGYWAAAQFDPRPSLLQLAADFPLRLVPAGYLGEIEPSFVPTTVPTTILFEWVGIALWATAIGWVLRSYLRDSIYQSQLDAQQARQLLMGHGDNPLAYLTMFHGNSYWFTADRSCYVAYRVSGGVAITTGDPIGPPAQRDAAVLEFIDFCRSRGWTPCWYSVTRQVTDATRRLGWARVQVAEATTLPLGSLAFTGRRYQDIRTALNRAGKAGVVAQWVSYPAAPGDIRTQIDALSQEWVSGKTIPEMGFTLGGLAELDDDAVRCLLAIDQDHVVHAVTSWLPVYRGGRPVGWTLDLMRRGHTAFNGSMEFLIATAALQFQAEGADFVSLSGSPLAHAHPAEPSGLARLLDRTGRTLEPIYGFRSLLAFKAKFQPDYEALYMSYPETATLPRIGVAITRAYLPQMTLRQGLRFLTRK